MKEWKRYSSSIGTEGDPGNSFYGSRPRLYVSFVVGEVVADQTK